MKYLVLLLILTGCVNVKPVQIDTPQTNGLPQFVEKFKDGNTTCYIYNLHGISCLKEKQ